LAVKLVSQDQLDYEPIYAGQSEWSLLPPLDHPDEPARCLVSGTGLTHVASARQRQAMHGPATVVTDSMRMFQWGEAGGKPAPGKVGVAPEWFYKGTGQILRGHRQPIDLPGHAEDGGEEPEIAGLYVMGFATGNEYSDHAFEKRNYLYLAPSKLRQAALGPELCVDASFTDLHGEVRVERAGHILWCAAIATGETNMSHSLVNLEHHHFKFEGHRRPGDCHVHFFGADSFSFSAGLTLAEGDQMIVSWEGMGRPLINPLRVLAPRPEPLHTVLPA
jgi:hypothetical protein